MPTDSDKNESNEGYVQLNGRTVFLVDVRDPEEFDAGHIEGAINIPYTRLHFLKEKLPTDKDMPIYTYCASGIRSMMAGAYLGDWGYCVFDLGTLEKAQAQFSSQSNLTPKGTLAQHKL
ncbi:MAG: rhodanese-like domain-containing protein [Alphaproteobacteria bacterium]|nr:rhodanese-like domain-containing protein [Alphaproteobacteria bacterium]